MVPTYQRWTAQCPPRPDPMDRLRLGQSKEVVLQGERCTTGTTPSVINVVGSFHTPNPRGGIPVSQMCLMNLKETLSREEG